jgi:hypothetical protein
MVETCLIDGFGVWNVQTSGPSYKRIVTVSVLALALAWAQVLVFSMATGHHHTLFGLPF